MHIVLKFDIMNPNLLKVEHLSNERLKQLFKKHINTKFTYMSTLAPNARNQCKKALLLIQFISIIPKCIHEINHDRLIYR